MRACVVVDRGRGSTTTIALEVMKELLGVEGVDAVLEQLMCLRIWLSVIS